MQKDTLSKNIQEQSFGGVCRCGKMGRLSRVQVISIGFAGQTGCESKRVIFKRVNWVTGQVDPYFSNKIFFFF